MIDLIRWRLHSDPFLSDLGLGVVALHGGMDVKARDATLKEFRENPCVRVLLMVSRNLYIIFNVDNNMMYHTSHNMRHDVVYCSSFSP